MTMHDGTHGPFMDLPNQHCADSYMLWLSYTESRKIKIVSEYNSGGEACIAWPSKWPDYILSNTVK